MSFDSPKTVAIPMTQATMRVSNFEVANKIPLKLGQYMQTSSVHQDEVGSPRNPMTKIGRHEVQFCG